MAEPLRFACLSTVAPGRDLAEQCDLIGRAGCRGVETLVFPHVDLAAWQAELDAACRGAGIEPAVVILGGLSLYVPGQLPWIREALAAIGELGAAALITPEYRPQDPLPLFPPYPAPPIDGVNLVMGAVEEIVQTGAQLGVSIYGEPLTPFESGYWRCLDDLLAVCTLLDERMANPKVASHFMIATDLHNFLLTEESMVGALEGAAERIAHVHLADSNRRLPGKGQIDFGPPLGTLRALGYAGWYSFECAVLPSETLEDRAADLFVRELSGCIDALSELAHPSVSIAPSPATHSG